MKNYSVSRVKTYLNNPWDYYQRYILNNKKELKNQKYLDRGTYFHKAMEIQAKEKQSESDELIERLKEEYDNEIINSEAFELGSEVIKRYHLWNSSFIEDKSLEEEFYFIAEIEELDNICIHGYIDSIRQDKLGNNYIVDYKTYSNKPQENEKQLDLQAWVYMYIANVYYDMKIKYFIFDCIGSKSKYPKNYWRKQKIKIEYNSYTANKIFEQFINCINDIEQKEEACEFPFVFCEYDSDYYMEYLEYIGKQSYLPKIKN